MTRITHIAPVSLAFLVAPALADPSTAEFEDARDACRDAFIARDADAYLDAAARMISWGAVENPDVVPEVELCLAFSDVLECADLEEARSRAAALAETGVATSDPAALTADGGHLAEYLARAQAEGADIAPSRSISPPMTASHRRQAPSAMR